MMIERFPAWIGLSLLAISGSLGCTMCSRDHLYDYAGAGGKWQRTNPTCGRVGSNLSDAGTVQNGTAIEFGANYGESWGLVEEAAPGGSHEMEIIEGELFDGDSPLGTGQPISAEPGMIMIGP